MADGNAADVVVSAIGAAFAVGDSVQGVAAIRAGLSRTSPTGLVVGTGTDDPPAPVKVHACRGVEGYQGLGRMFALLRLAVADVRRHGRPPAGPVPAFVLLPELAGRPRVEDTDERLLTGAALTAALSQRLEPIARGGELALRHGSRCQMAADVATALDRLRNGRAERCLLVAVDSLVEEATLELLYGDDRLQTAVNQDGFFAGEAAAILQLERADVARQSGAVALAQVGATSFEAAGAAPPGTATARAMQACCVGAVPPAAIWTDLNGASWRANDWGHALQRLTAKAWPGLAARVHTPVEGYGELGSASVVAQLVCAVRAAARTGAGPQLVVAADEAGDRCALTLLPVAAR